MRSTGYFLEGLLELGQLRDGAAQRASFRQSIVSLGQATQIDGPGPLEGVSPDALLPAVRVALETGLVDDLGWLSPDAAAVALYEIAAALPPGAEKREVGRRVAAYAFEGSADTFAAVATRMAIGSGKGLGGTPVRARVALALELPSGLSSRVQGLALALASRRELSREWIVRPAEGSLPARRLSARLIERAAGEAARRADQGDDHWLRIFRTEPLATAWRDLLEDRESLVWRHAAVARGALAGAVSELAEAIERDLSPRLSPTEWRRAATSLAASLGSDPDQVTRRIRELMDSEVVEQDPGVAASLLFGLVHGAKFEPDAAMDLVTLVLERQHHAAAESFEEVARIERSWFSSGPAAALRQKLVLAPGFGTADDGALALSEEIANDLDPHRADRPARVVVTEALSAFAFRGARAAHELAQEALVLARAAVSSVEKARHDSSPSRRDAFALLRDLDIALLESAVLPNLLALDRRPLEPALSTPAVHELQDRIAALLIAREADPPNLGELIAHPTLPLRRLRTLLHLLDADTDEAAEQRERAAAVRRRWLDACQVLLRRLSLDPPAVLERTLCAALARALDGLLRTEVCEVVDVILLLACRLRDPAHWSTLSEASMQPDLIAALRRYHALLLALAPPSPPPLPRGPEELWPPPPSAFLPLTDPLEMRLASFRSFAVEMSSEGSGREEALRAVLVRLSRALDAVHQAGSLGDLSSGGSASSPLASLEGAASALSQLVMAARRKMGDEPEDAAPRSVLHPSKDDLSRLVSRAAGDDPALVRQVVVPFVRGISDSMPDAMLDLLAATLDYVAALPLVGPESRKTVSIDSVLPSWLPARRTLGGFFILRPIGAGAVGSVFVAKRIEERSDPAAECFALKVPDYDPLVARHLSEAEFLQLFRNEASALLGLPTHPNLARFVTFDLAARPKPILVMELVEGPTVENLLDARRMTIERATAVLDGVLTGLEAMHEVGIGHLDVKPSNVILRNDSQPVLVDFGLAGRHLRPGCGTGAYQAPEIWGIASDDAPPPPMAADVYAFGCLAFEALSGTTLFEQEGETALVSAHVAHDGWPWPLQAWRDVPILSALGALLSSALRHDPRSRASVPALRKGLSALAPSLSRFSWPLAV